ncbi:hypothetical protein K0040_02515 [Terrisporobacter petrolearius]|uniref:hypothetical protein n=1 Tax=Terrisporobacter petrolearius TaxID=1460447 RepID=UPI001D16AABA|nr:hypothetical protein [Terrisporobacter petrolearius]MCC3863185.1 hypothetical protein [Terrisporobacter petrolearius]
MKNTVIDGDYKNCLIKYDKGKLTLEKENLNLDISNDIIEEYKLIHTIHKRNILDIIARLVIAICLAGPVGILAIFTSNMYISYHIVSLEFKDGKKSLLKINNRLYEKFINLLNDI